MLSRGGFPRVVRSASPPPTFKPSFLGKKPCHSVRYAPTYARPLSKRALHSLDKKADPLFLFYCGLNWHRGADTSSGWELVQAMRSSDCGSRALAAELLAETENGRLLVRDLRRTRSGLRQIVSTARVTGHISDLQSEAETMKTPYGLQVVEDCNACPLRKKGWYCSLSGDLLKSFSDYSHLTTYPGGAILFVEGQAARGVFVLCSGKVKLSTTSKEGKVLVFRVMEPGDVIGLSAMISDQPYEVTAETMEPCLVNFVEREGLLRLMERSGELGLRSALAVSREFQSTYRDIQDLVLSRSSSGKLARLLLSWIGEERHSQNFRIHAPVTHEEIAHRIGTSRETVTRLLSDLRKRNFVQLEGSTLIIKNRTALEQMAI